MNIEKLDISCLPKITEAVPINIKKYLFNDNYWLGDFIRELGYDSQLSSLEVDPIPFVMNPDKEPPSTDVENAKIIYKTLNLSPEVACNGAFWTIMSHHYLPYLRYRYKLDQKTEDEQISKIQKEFVFPVVLTKRNRRESVLPRLWTIADMTFDPTRTGNEFELTEVMLSNQDLANNILDRTLFMNKYVTHTFLDYYKSRSDSGNPLSRDEVRALQVFLYAYSDIVVIESLDSFEIKTKILEFEDWYKSKYKS
ncbi:MAG: hypothetical protein KRP56_03780 [Candidatus Methanogranum gryphiswaldense]|nr:MAG: hypothetical protein KRP56_03780 [Candidatus Methanogranum sp. U3.2.1]